MKKLGEMTLEELWHLFPIELVDPQNAQWKTIFAKEKKLLESLLPANIKIHHIGSTAINGIWAKPIVDVLIEADIDAFNSSKRILTSNGYICMAESERILDFNKGYTPEGFADEVFHIHVKEPGNNDELYFRDYLNDHPDVAKDYETLKLSLWKQYEFNRDEYTNQKTEFIRKYTSAAQALYKKTRYSYSSNDDEA